MYGPAKGAGPHGGDHGGHGHDHGHGHQGGDKHTHWLIHLIWALTINTLIKPLKI